MKSSGVTSGNLSSVKLLKIIEYLCDIDSPARLLDISNDTKINASTVLRFVTTLKQEGFVGQDEHTGKYFMTYKICNLANKVSSNLDIRMLAKPYLALISNSFNSTCNLVVEYDRSAMYLEVITSNNQVYMPLQRIGSIAPLHCTGAGKLFLTEYDDIKLNDLYRTKGFEKLTQHTLTDISSLKKELLSIENNGFAYDNEECELGTICIAVPVYDYTGKITAAISVNGRAEKMTPDFLKTKLPFMQECAEQLSIKLGYVKE